MNTFKKRAARVFGKAPCAGRPGLICYNRDTATVGA
jgi:hypothetical protein